MFHKILDDLYTEMAKVTSADSNTNSKKIDSQPPISTVQHKASLSAQCVMGTPFLDSRFFLHSPTKISVYITLQVLKKAIYAARQFPSRVSRCKKTHGMLEILWSAVHGLTWTN